ncbi:MAG: DUF2141 domain-containing protein [Treponema sp.]|jgi:uncharacterized protein (DUF2141 family)|nr:DUF2141 domain-containing protein [Treponema sp.]
MKRTIIFLFLSFVFCGLCFSQETVNVTVEVTNVAVNGGKVYLAIFSNNASFQKEDPEIAFELQSDKAAISREVSLLPGEYVVSAFQDANNNVKLDYGLFGIPKELVGISNYSGKGFPSKSFDKQKILIDSKVEKIIIGLYKF